MEDEKQLVVVKARNITYLQVGIFGNLKINK